MGGLFSHNTQYSILDVCRYLDRCCQSLLLWPLQSLDIAVNVSLLSRLQLLSVRIALAKCESNMSGFYDMYPAGLQR